MEFSAKRKFQSFDDDTPSFTPFLIEIDQEGRCYSLISLDTVELKELCERVKKLNKLNKSERYETKDINKNTRVI